MHKLRMFGVESTLGKKCMGAAAALACLAPLGSAAALVATPMHVDPVTPAEEDCAFDPRSRSASLAALVAPARQEKSAAILGGMSALELMRSEQVTFAQPASEAGSTQDLLEMASSLEPAIGGSMALREGCASNNAGVAMLARPGLNQLPSAAPRSGDFLQSRRVPIGSTRFDAQWRRVRHGSLSEGQVARAVGSESAPGQAMLDRVNAWVNNNIRYVEDARLWGSPDYWATASETLGRAKGDCEDLAIVKMKILEQAGFRREDMYLTVARDLYRNADHAFLVVKLDGEFFVLDNAIDRVLTAGEDLGYRPVLSFSSHRSWLHGY